MAAGVIWHGDKLVSAMQGASRDGITRAAVFFLTGCKNVVNKSARVGGSLSYESAPPGDPPRKRTGFGQQSISFESNLNLQDFRVRVGVLKNAAYMAMHELGGKNLAQRPWMVPTLKRQASQLSSLVRTAMPQGAKREVK